MPVKDSIFSKVPATLLKYELLHRYFQGFYLLFRNNYLKDHLWVAAYVCFNREASQGSTYFLGK